MGAIKWGDERGEKCGGGVVCFHSHRTGLKLEWAQEKENSLFESCDRGFLST